jgi:hypothetical protein
MDPTGSDAPMKADIVAEEKYRSLPGKSWHLKVEPAFAGRRFAGLSGAP